MPRVLTLPQRDAGSRPVRAKALVFEDPRSQVLLARIRALAPSEATVLIVGETGTGKEIVARHLHELSRRAAGPFVAVNCAALSDALVDSDLFGHERGAFTGAAALRRGWFEAADGGTLFLDEIGDLSPALQVKLLRVLQEREVVRLGGLRSIPVDVRVLAATNVDLDAAVAAGRYREDLYYRLKVAVLPLPPLRLRPGDVLPLARHFLATFARRMGASARDFSPAAADRLLAHGWPGNIRELENAVHAAVLVSEGDVIEAGALSLDRARVPTRPAPPPSGAPSPAHRQLASAFVDLFAQGGEGLAARIDETVVRSAFKYCHRNQVQTARLLGITRNILRARLMAMGEIKRGRRRGQALAPLI